MTSDFSTAKRGDYVATIAYNKCIARDIWAMGLHSTDAGAAAYAALQPGQFAELDLSLTSLPREEDVPAELRDKMQRQIILRRPFSFSNAYAEKGGLIAEVVYAVIGPATLRMTTVQKGDTMAVIGPLGHGFDIHAEKKVALLIGGGLGIPPIEHLARMLSSDHSKMKTVAFVGSRSKDTLPFEVQTQGKRVALPPFETCGIEYHIATDDGSAGHHGLVTQCVETWLAEHNIIAKEDIEVFSCGPEPMLAAVAKLAEDHGLDGQVSLERRMACGFNLCQGCAVEIYQSEGKDTVYQMCCEAGPVFDAKEVVFE